MKVEEVHLRGFADMLVNQQRVVEGVVIIGFKGNDSFTVHAGADRIYMARLAQALWNAAKDMSDAEEVPEIA